MGKRTLRIQLVRPGGDFRKPDVEFSIGELAVEDERGRAYWSFAMAAGDVQTHVLVTMLPGDDDGVSQ